MKALFTCLILFSGFYIFGQNEIILGAGQSDGIVVSTSSNYAETGWTHTANGLNTINGNGLEGAIMEASRFLAQSSVTFNHEEINNVIDLGIEEWIDDQLQKSPSLYLPYVHTFYEELNNIFLANGGDSTDLPTHPRWTDFNYAWWQLNMTNEDLLRHRFALAMSEIMVVSHESDLSGHGDALADYMDIFVRNADGNFRDILMEVTLHPAMGYYLSHLNNPRTVPDENIHPDENYAREVMQLFTIGLYELNQDGSYKLDADGQLIPTYGQDEIGEFAKVFTGLGVGDIIPNQWVDEPDFGYSIYIADMTVPMQMYEFWHEPGEKHLLNGVVIPDGQSGMEDIEDAIENLFNHPNVGPFIGRQLIQRLVKSNPSPEYIRDVAAAFNNNGQGVRGDIKAVLKAILTHEEARSCSWMNQIDHGRLREPLLRHSHFARAIGGDSPSDYFLNVGYGYWQDVGQIALGSPTVFNFYLPDFQPIGPIADNGLVAPEYQIHNTKTSIGYLNHVYRWTQWEYLMEIWTNNYDGQYNWNVYTDFTRFVEDSKDPEVLINKLDVLLTHGQLTDRTRNIIKEALEESNGGLLGIWEQITLAAYLIMISPDYNVLK